MTKNLCATFIKQNLLISTVFASNPYEPASNLLQYYLPPYSMISSFFVLMPLGWWIFPHSVHLYLSAVLFVAFSLPSGFGRGNPPYPLSTRLNLLCPCFSSLAFLFFTLSTSCIVCFLQYGQYVFIFLGFSISIQPLNAKG